MAVVMVHIIEALRLVTRCGLNLSLDQSKYSTYALCSGVECAVLCVRLGQTDGDRYTLITPKYAFMHVVCVMRRLEAWWMHEESSMHLIRASMWESNLRNPSKTRSVRSIHLSVFNPYWDVVVYEVRCQRISWIITAMFDNGSYMKSICLRSLHWHAFRIH